MCVACSSRDAHTLAAGDNNSLWAWGSGSYGKLGTKDQISSNIPVMVTSLSSNIVQIECGMNFSVLLTKEGKVYTW